MKIKVSIMLFCVLFLSLGSCKKEKPLDDNSNDEIKVTGFEFFNKIVGLWHGPVSSATPAGNFDNWYVDFRPVSESQVSHFSLLDTNTVNNLSFFIVKHAGILRLAMRTEGCFNTQCCVTYEVLDSVNQEHTYFRFSDFVAGTGRAYTEFIFNDDSLTMKVYTNKFNTVSPLELHSEWNAVSGGRTNATAAINHFNYPKAVMVRDFSSAFSSLSESIYYTFDNDPYKSEEQPYVGNVSTNIALDSSLNIMPNHKILLLFTTQTLFNGFIYVPENLKFISKYVLLSPTTPSYQIKNFHPGTYFVYSLIDVNNDGFYNSGDYMNADFQNTFTLEAEQSVVVNTVIDYVIP